MGDTCSTLLRRRGAGERKDSMGEEDGEREEKKTSNLHAV